jgi:xanthine dehydrogenase accessory factor
MNTNETVLAAAQRLQAAGTPYALVSVIRALAPASARAGDKAVVTADGRMHGWVGGGCAQPAVLRTVQRALADGQAQLIRITPATEGAEKTLGDVLEFGMSCHSGGTLELFVDPVLPRARLVILGASPVAQALSQLAPRVGFAVTVVAQDAVAADWPDADQVLASDAAASAAQIPPGAWAVVATQGRRDVQALRLALALQARQVSFVASARKAEVLKAGLRSSGVDAAAVDAIVAPAGLPIPAHTPEEIALSVLAAVVSHRRGGGALSATTPALEAALAVPMGGAPSRDLEVLDKDRTAPLAGEAAPVASCCGGPVGELPPLPAVRPALAAAAVADKPSCCGG